MTANIVIKSIITHSMI